MAPRIADNIVTVNPFDLGKFIALRGKHPEGNWREAPPLTLRDIEARTSRNLWTGFAPKAGYVVLDLDIKGGGNLEALIDECIAKGYLPNREILSQSWHQDTASGGRHYLATSPPGTDIPQRVNIDPTLQHGQLDLRVGGKGYIVVAPSPGYHSRWTLEEVWPIAFEVEKALLNTMSTTRPAVEETFEDLGGPSDNLKIKSSILDELNDKQLLDLCNTILQKLNKPHVGQGLRDFWRNVAWALQDIARHRPKLAMPLRDLWIAWSLTGDGAPNERTLQNEWTRLDRTIPANGKHIGAGTLLRFVTPEMLDQVRPPQKQEKVKSKAPLVEQAVDLLKKHPELHFFSWHKLNHVCFARDTWPNRGIPVDTIEALGWYDRLLSEQGLHYLTAAQLKQVAEKLLLTDDIRVHAPPVTFRIHGTEEAAYMVVGDRKTAKILTVDKNGHRIIQTNNIFFRVQSRCIPQPVPRSGNPNALEELLDLFYLDETNKKQIITWLLSVLRGIPPHPVCVLYGGAGAAKSTLARVLRRLVDPLEDEQLNHIPRKQFTESVTTITRNYYMLAYDNAGKLSEDEMDELCVVSTGGSTSRRKLYTDNDVSEIRYNNCVIITTIAGIPHRPDLLSRCIVVEMDTISATHRRDDISINRKIDELLPYAFDCLLQMMAQGYANIDTLQQHITTNKIPTPRMSSAAIWAEACGVKNVIQLTLKEQASAQAETVEQNPITKAVVKMLQEEGDFEGSSSDLYEKLKPYVGKIIPIDQFPQSEVGLGRIIRRYQAAFVAAGYDFYTTRTSTKRCLHIKKASRRRKTST